MRKRMKLSPLGGAGGRRFDDALGQLRFRYAIRPAVLAHLFAAVVIAAFAIRVKASTIPNATLQVRGGTIDVEFAEGNFDLPRKALLDRVTQAADAVSTYYGHFPVPHYRVLIVPIEGRRGVLTFFNSKLSRSQYGKYAS